MTPPGWFQERHISPVTRFTIPNGWRVHGRTSCAGLDTIRADVVGYPRGKVPPIHPRAAVTSDFQGPAGFRRVIIRPMGD